MMEGPRSLLLTPSHPPSPPPCVNPPMQTALIISRSLSCFLVYSVASLIAAGVTKYISTHFYKSTHFKKLKAALEKEFQLQVRHTLAPWGGCLVIGRQCCSSWLRQEHFGAALLKHSMTPFPFSGLFRRYLCRGGRTSRQTRAPASFLGRFLWRERAHGDLWRTLSFLCPTLPGRAGRAGRAGPDQPAAAIQETTAGRWPETEAV